MKRSREEYRVHRNGQFLAIMLLTGLLASASLNAQTTDQRWSFGISGGGNVWINDLTTAKPGVGFSLGARYALSSSLSVGLTAGLEELKSADNAPSSDSPYSYMKLFAIPVSINLYYRILPRSTVSPYLFLGGGGMMYQRRGTGGEGLPDTRWRGTYVIPAGLGCEIFASASVSLTAELGYVNVGEWIDLIKNGTPDGYLSGRIGVHWFPDTEGQEDVDLDGLTDEQERHLGTDPHNPDTDGDKLTDGDEVRKYHTNPLRADTDGDGLTDGDEVLRYQTDPTRYDTDGDGLSDGEEILKYNTDPLRSDTDGDGLSDGDEITRYHTDPLKIDSDGDGLTDLDEVKTYHTDPNNPDTDGDGIIDGEEVFKYKTDPLKADTDGGGMIDGAEIIRGTDPLNPADDMKMDRIRLLKGSTIVLEGVEFDPASAQLSASSEEALRKISSALLGSPGLRVEIAGYTDNVGSHNSNLRLSQRRAESVREWLVAKGIAPERLSARGYGASNPIDSNGTASGRARNRRIELHVQ